jgi:hypothetical protein
MKKKIGITCDDYKANKFRKGLMKAGFELEYDGKSGIKNVHLFRVECEEKDYEKMVEQIGKTVKRLDVEFKHSN